MHPNMVGKKSRLNVVNVTVQPQVLVPSSVNRVALGFIASPGGYFAVKDDKPSGANDGMIVNTNMDPVWVPGDIVQKEWWVWSQGVPQMCCYIEVLGP